MESSAYSSGLECHSVCYMSKECVEKTKLENQSWGHHLYVDALPKQLRNRAQIPRLRTQCIQRRI